jgi:hypothetical protein
LLHLNNNKEREFSFTRFHFVENTVAFLSPALLRFEANMKSSLSGLHNRNEAERGSALTALTWMTAKAIEVW